MNIEQKMEHIYRGIDADKLKDPFPHEPSLGYGETPPATVDFLLRTYKRKEHKIFYDPLAGIGNVVIQAGLFSNRTNGYFEKAIGIEYVRDRYGLARQALANATSARVLVADVRFINKDCREVWMGDADMVYANATSLSDEVMSGLVARFEELASGARVIVVERELPTRSFTLFKNPITLPVNHMKSHIFVYDRI